jgi:hypothetical protein
VVGSTEGFCRQKNSHPASTKFFYEPQERAKEPVRKGVVVSILGYQVCAEKCSTAPLEKEGTVHGHWIYRHYHSL